LSLCPQKREHNKQICRYASLVASQFIFDFNCIRSHEFFSLSSAQRKFAMRYLQAGCSAFN